ncbi:hypothetical protein Glove_355g96 [Diversispora epigaea]|uniref:Crinkler effector protein N-terminal domain-containing protein n=1 Tax=Diversispora epigaea TaxID=1348612 RepID=A0A397HB05_9GLOM|nr:hypothetical protein Glove_355g96 [Diversispora epigaea]
MLFKQLQFPVPSGARYDELETEIRGRLPPRFKNTSFIIHAFHPELDMSITLICLVKGSTFANAFAVDIDGSKLVGHLKEAIKAKNQNDFAGVDADKLRLWKVEIPDDRDDLLNNISFQGQDELLATRDIKNYWTEKPPKRHIHVIVRLLFSLEETLSCITSPIKYSPNATTSTSTTSVNYSTRPKEVLPWDTFFEKVNQFNFDQRPEFQGSQFKKPWFRNNVNVINEEDVRDAFHNNICMVLNELMGPDYEFSRRRATAAGIPDFTGYFVDTILILTIEIKRELISQNIDRQIFPDFYNSDEKTRTVIQQIYNYMVECQLQYGVLSTYEHHWFLCRSKETPSKLLISETLPSQSKSPSVLKAYAYIALQARADHLFPKPDIITVPVNDVTKRINMRVTRSMVQKEEKISNNESSLGTLTTNQPNQENFSFADFKFKSILGEGRKGGRLN